MNWKHIRRKSLVGADIDIMNNGENDDTDTTVDLINCGRAPLKMASSESAIKNPLGENSGMQMERDISTASTAIDTDANHVITMPTNIVSVFLLSSLCTN